MFGRKKTPAAPSSPQRPWQEVAAEGLRPRVFGLPQKYGDGTIADRNTLWRNVRTVLLNTSGPNMRVEPASFHVKGLAMSLLFMHWQDFQQRTPLGSSEPVAGAIVQIRADFAEWKSQLPAVGAGRNPREALAGIDEELMRTLDSFPEGRQTLKLMENLSLAEAQLWAPGALIVE